MEEGEDKPPATKDQQLSSPFPASASPSSSSHHAQQLLLVAAPSGQPLNIVSCSSTVPTHPAHARSSRSPAATTPSPSHSTSLGCCSPSPAMTSFLPGTAACESSTVGATFELAATDPETVNSTPADRRPASPASPFVLSSSAATSFSCPAVAVETSSSSLTNLVAQQFPPTIPTASERHFDFEHSSVSNTAPPVHDVRPIASFRPDPDIPDQTALPAAVDPLLQNGSFIDATPVKPSTDNDNSHQQEAANGGSVEPPPPTAATPLRSRRKVPVYMAVALSSDSANWLSPGWVVEDRVRTAGATAGTVDKYYADPVSNRRFRSKKEVQYYLETGMLKPKKTKATENPEIDSSSTGSAGSKKSQKTNKKAKVVKRNFDYVNVPEKVEWALTDAIQDKWTPSVGGQKVAESERQNWEFEMTHRQH
ncbi:flocculation protein FLO11-like [Mercurialis annua]|uniref:flocculation protein FLO11-like n=1 Tax=Mercurialis annua TaxID=3986 RepID=UPI00215E9FE3|nr:flocculation protein FLO11-like [Mercurialis annua]